MSQDKYITTHTAATLLNVGERRVRTMCGKGVFRTAHKPGYGDQSRWLILGAEISAHNGHKHKQQRKVQNAPTRQ